MRELVVLYCVLSLLRGRAEVGAGDRAENPAGWYRGTERDRGMRTIQDIAA